MLVKADVWLAIVVAVCSLQYGFELSRLLALRLQKVSPVVSQQESNKEEGEDGENKETSGNSVEAFHFVGSVVHKLSDENGKHCLHEVAETLQYPVRGSHGILRNGKTSVKRKVRNRGPQTRVDRPVADPAKNYQHRHFQQSARKGKHVDDEEE